MRTQPIAEVGDRADFMGWVPGNYFQHGRMANMVGEVIDVIPGPILHGCQMEHQYVLENQDGRHRVHESNLSTPFGKEGFDD